MPPSLLPDRRRAVVTGLGVVSALGSGASALSLALREARSGIGPLTLFDPAPYGARVAGQAPAPGTRFLGRTPRSASRADRFALDAAAEALAEAQLPEATLEASAVVLGTGAGGAELAEGYLAGLRLRGERHTPVSQLAHQPPASSTDLVGNTFGSHGPRLSLMTACSSSATAIGVALDWIRVGRAECVITGGTDALCALTFGGFTTLRALDPEACRPFHRQRRGLTLGEGAAILVLEEAEAARKRGARTRGEIAGYGVSADAHHLTAPHPDGRGAVHAMQRALADAELEAAEVDYVNAHGTGTPQNDLAEARAIRAVFGELSSRVPVSSTKAMTGHPLGAAGAIEAVVCLLALEEQLLPATLRLDDPDPACPLDLVPLQPRSASLGVVLSNSFAFGGNNTALVLRRWPA
ncbi:MAG: beta-ketoacyl-[acyl-carrier-protein] synthase family protein [Deltaproteobacteria bacterium]|nr:beta-ketoacyl-[acyl-carrier-protein] synthase family protein [Deltaproteobacteria bacterium]